MLAYLSAVKTPTMHLVTTFYQVALQKCDQFVTSRFKMVKVLATKLKETLGEKYAKLWTNARGMKVTNTTQKARQDQR